MAYTIIDLLDKIIEISKIKKDNCISAMQNMEKGSHNYILLKVFDKSIGKHIKYYEKLKNDISENGTNIEEIDFQVYDKISYLVNEFKHHSLIPDNNFNNVEESYLKFQKEVLALYLDIQGRMVKSEKDTKTEAYKTFCEIISYKQKNIAEIEKFIKDYLE